MAAVSAGVIAKAALTVLSNDKLRKGVGWAIVAVLSPVILIIAFLCCLGSGSADHNNLSVEASFYNATFSEEIPVEYKAHILDMQASFTLLDSKIAVVNAMAEEGGLDALQVKVVVPYSVSNAPLIIAVIIFNCFGVALLQRA